MVTSVATGLEGRALWMLSMLDNFLSFVFLVVQRRLGMVILNQADCEKEVTRKEAVELLKHVPRPTQARATV
jgi:hypothetical protein